LDEEIYISTPVTAVVYYARKLQDLHGIGQIPMQITNGYYVPSELAPSMLPGVHGD